MTSGKAAYGLLAIAGIILTVTVWSRLTRRNDRLFVIYLAALLGALLGAKVFYLLAEGWRDIGQPDMWLRLATGKTILGGLFGGYIAVEVAKRLVGHAGATGDWFAVVTPVGILLGRVGCLLHGCCLGGPCDPAWYTLPDALGQHRWPAVPMEIAFNVLAIGVFAALRFRRLLSGQHFHLYLIAYGAFRFAHEFVRDTPDVLGGFSGYQFAALAVFVLGTWRFVQRQRAEYPVRDGEVRTADVADRSSC